MRVRHKAKHDLHGERSLSNQFQYEKERDAWSRRRKKKLQRELIKSWEIHNLRPKEKEISLDCKNKDTLFLTIN